MIFLSYGCNMCLYKVAYKGALRIMLLEEKGWHCGHVERERYEGGEKFFIKVAPIFHLVSVNVHSVYSDFIFSVSERRFTVL